MSKFNNGKAYHGSDSVMNGKLKGSTDETDYFYFFCPKCPDNHIMRILEYEVREEEKGNRYNKDFKIKAKNSFILAFKIHCANCGHNDFVKISNTGWQGGKLSDILK